MIDELKTESDKIIAPVIGVFTLLFCVIQGFISNYFALKYFLVTYRTNVFSEIYCMICACDMLITVMTTSVACSYISGRKPLFYSNGIYCEIWGSAWNVLTRFSVHLVLLISITRAIKIYYPHSVIKSKVIRIITIADIFLLIALTPGIFGYRHYFKYEWAAVALNKTKTNNYSDIVHHVIVNSIPGLLLTPLPIVIVTCIISVVKVNMDTKRCVTSKRNRAEIARHSTITVITFTLTYIILNIPYAVLYTVFNINTYRNVPFYERLGFKSHVARMYITGLTHVLSISINSAVNPLIYYCRMSEFKLFVQQEYYTRQRKSDNTCLSDDAVENTQNDIKTPNGIKVKRFDEETYI